MSRPKSSALRERVREALTGIKPRRPGARPRRPEVFDLDGRDAGRVRVMLRGGYDKGEVVKRLCGAGLTCKPKDEWVDAWVPDAAEREDNARGMAFCNPVGAMAGTKGGAA
ncbi:MAG: hypothetical protein MUF34_34015 [Polyangiaceae bacterium]|jgi:hypothetical protein|nr:hypothetical protein [Polyangiaceae bacterium]